MGYIGLDLGTASLKMVAAVPMGANYRLDSIGSVQNPAGSVDFEDLQVRQKVGENLKKMLSETGVKERRVVVGIPESKVYSRVVSMPVMSDVELSSAIGWEAEQFVPVPIAEVEMDFSVVRRPPAGSKDTSMLVYVIASPKKYLQETVDFLIDVGLEPIAIESEMVAATRSLITTKLVGATLILHMGAQSTVFGIVDNDALLFSYVLPTGGVALTRSLAQTLAFPMPQAEEYKRTYGLDGNQFEGKVRGALMVVFSAITTELHKAVEYHAVQYKASVSRILLSGGGAYLPALSAQLSSEFSGIEIMTADPFANAKYAKGMTLPQDKASYSVAVGLAIRIF